MTGHQFDTNDPLEVLRRGYALDPVTGRRVEDAVVPAEIEAARVSAPEVVGAAALRRLAQQGKLIAIVSRTPAGAAATRGAGTYCLAFASKPAEVTPFRSTGVPVVLAMTEIDPSRA